MSAGFRSFVRDLSADALVALAAEVRAELDRRRGILADVDDPRVVHVPVVRVARLPRRPDPDAGL